MEIRGKIYCFFEQSGTFKNEFRKLGYKAEDYDIQDEYGETDHICDLFKEIEAGYDGKPSIFDEITPDDLVLAFFPCIYFCGISQMNITLATYEWRHKTLDGAEKYIFERLDMRERYYKLLIKFCFICIKMGIRMVFENPFSTNTYLKGNFIKPPDVVDTDRTRRGDYMVKPTAYWFFNCQPTKLESRQTCRKEERKFFAIHTTSSKPKEKVVRSGKAGLCSKERSEISTDYARNFICDFIIGKVQPNTLPTLF